MCHECLEQRPALDYSYRPEDRARGAKSQERLASPSVDGATSEYRDEQTTSWMRRIGTRVASGMPGNDPAQS